MRSIHQKIIIVTLALIAIAWTSWQRLEWVDDKRWVPAQAEVINRPMLAAGLYLQSLGIPVSRIVDQKRFDDIPDSVGTVFVCEGKMLLSNSHYWELNYWVSQGGHLVINASGGGQLTDQEQDEGQKAYGVRSVPIARIYRELGIQAGNANATQDCWRQDIDFEPDGSNKPRDVADMEDALENLAQLINGASSPVDTFETVHYRGALPGFQKARSAVVEFEAANWLEFDEQLEPQWRWQTDRGTQLLSTKVGEGRVTVMSDFSPFFNASIGMKDNAFALQAIAQYGNTEGTAVWFHERELAFPSLASVLWKRSPELVLCFLLAGLLTVWALFARRVEPQNRSHHSVSQLRTQLYARAFYRWRVRDTKTFSRLLDLNPHALRQAEENESDVVKDEKFLTRSKTALLDQVRTHCRAAKRTPGG